MAAQTIVMAVMMTVVDVDWMMCRRVGVSD